jgi:peptide/nickel transport system substrate-binding protein
MATPEGTVTLGFKDVGVYECVPGTMDIVTLLLIGRGALEGAITIDAKGSYSPNLVQEWSVAPDNLTWTFKIRKGITFHKGYGEMTSEDVIWSIQRMGQEGSIAPRAGAIKKAWLNPDGWVKAIDDYTIELNTGIPSIDVLDNIKHPTTGLIISKKQIDELGEEETTKNCAGTGPWELVDTRASEFWKMSAVEDHWRKTPEFAEMVLLGIPEESTRVANFLAGKVDTFEMAPDSKSAVEVLPGIKWIQIKNSGETHIALGGNWYVPEKPRIGYKPEWPWVSSNGDVNSPEWEEARKVREAMAIAIDRETIVDTLLGGAGSPGVMFFWLGHHDRLDPDQKWEYDPERARQLLSEAGYPDGFSITVNVNIRGIPAETEACEAMATMWEEVGIRTRITKLSVAAVTTPLMIERNYEALCHGTGFHTEPAFVASIIWHSEGRISLGPEHPILDDFIDRANQEFDPEKRWGIQKEMGRWLFDNALNIGMYNAHTEWPLSPRIDTWEKHLQRGDTRRISQFEYIPHRK